jgi:hypothetical protein
MLSMTSGEQAQEGASAYGTSSGRFGAVIIANTSGDLYSFNRTSYKRRSSFRWSSFRCTACAAEMACTAYAFECELQPNKTEGERAGSHTRTRARTSHKYNMSSGSASSSTMMRCDGLSNMNRISRAIVSTTCGPNTHAHAQKLIHTSKRKWQLRI